MKILATIIAFSLLTAVKLSAAPIAPDSVVKALTAANDTLQPTPHITVSLSYTFGQQSTANGDLRAAQYIHSPSMIIPAMTAELLARNDSIKTAVMVQMRNDSTKAAEFTQKAAGYLNYDTISDKEDKLTAENQAIAYTMKAIHFYSRTDDTIGLRNSF